MRILALLLAVVALAACAPRALAEGLVVDGAFADWASVPTTATDPAGDGAPGRVDFTRLHVADEGGRLFLRFDTTRETTLQESSPTWAGNSIVLLVDADNNPATGLATQGIGAEFRLAFGQRTITQYNAAGVPVASPAVTPSGLASSPTHSGTEFEARVNLSALAPAGGPVVQAGTEIALVLLDDAPGGDRLPNADAVRHVVTGAAAPPVQPIDLAREPGTLRVFCHNVLNNGPTTNPGPWARMLAATQPDLVAFQEAYAWTPQEAAAWMEAHYPLPGGAPWQAAKVNDCVLFSPWPILAEAAVDGNLVALVDLPDDISAHDLVLFNVHTPCCATGNPGRDEEHDHLAATWRDLLAGAGPFLVDPASPVLMIGDFNMVGFERQLRSVRDGDILDNATWGPDFAPARAAGSLVAARLRHTHEAEAYTWRSDGGAFSPGRLDWMLHSPDTMTLVKDFALFTPGIPAGDLALLGLQADDSTASDHVPLVADYRLGPPSAGVHDWRRMNP